MSPTMNGRHCSPRLRRCRQRRWPSRAGGDVWFGGGRRGGPGGGAPADANVPQSPVAAASKDLQDLLDNKDSTSEQIKVKLTALREARTKAHEELVAAQAELKELLTARQEAVLVVRGMLD